MDWMLTTLKAIYSDEIFYYMTIFFVKVSLMLLYLRLAAELRGWFYYASVTLLIVLVLHFMTTMTVVATQCIPIEKYWRPSTPGNCIDITAFFYCKPSCEPTRADHILTLGSHQHLHDHH